MVELFEQALKTNEIQSSKGNQLKWETNQIWYKADYTGYEGLAEYLISFLLEKSSLKPDEFVQYKTEEIKYKDRSFCGCKSNDFLKAGYRLITLERLFKNLYGESLTKAIYWIEDTENRVLFLVNKVKDMTGLNDFGIYLSKLLTIDAVFLNEDRHMHNIAVLVNDIGEFDYCPIFDNGAALLSDTMIDYPLDGDIEHMMKEAKSKTICQNFDEQLDAVEKLYGKHIQFHFTIRDVESILSEENCYSDELKERIITILRSQRRKYQYLFA